MNICHCVCVWVVCGAKEMELLLPLANGTMFVMPISYGLQVPMYTLQFVLFIAHCLIRRKCV